MTGHTTIRAIIMAFCGFSLWTVGDALIRHLNGYPPVQIGFICGVYSLAWLVTFSPLLGGLRATFQKPRMGLQVFRGIVLALSGLMSFYAFGHLELPTAYAIIFVTPFLAKIFSVLLNGEKASRACWAVSLVAFAGVLVVIRPGVLPVNIGVAAAFLLAVLFALGYVLGRTIGEENQTILSLSLFADMAMVVLLAGPVVHFYVPMTPFDFGASVLIGVFSAIGTLLVSLAYTRAPAAYVAPAHYVQIVWGVVWSALFFKEYPDAWTLAGAAVIIAAGIALVRLGRAG